MVFLLFAKIVQAIFLGPLHRSEVEQLFHKAKYMIPETCLALTIFREELSLAIVALFVELVFVKSFHWLAQRRVENVRVGCFIVEGSVSGLDTWR